MVLNSVRKVSLVIMINPFLGQFSRLIPPKLCFHGVQIGNNDQKLGKTLKEETDGSLKFWLTQGSS